MIDQKSLVSAELPLESNLVARSARSTLNSLTIANINPNACLKVGIFISLVTAINLPSLNQVAQAGTNNLKLQNQSTTKNKGFSYIKQSQGITSFLPRLLSLITFSEKPDTLLTTSVNDSKRISATPVVPPTINQIKRVDIVANKLKSHQATNLESSVTSPQLIYLVQQGDTLNKIAKKYQVSKDELVKLNQIKNSNIIFVNQRLKIPVTKANQVSLNSTEQQGTILASAVASETITQKPIFRQNSASLEEKNTAVSQDDPYLAKLRAEIELLRTQNKQQSSAVANNSTATSLSSELNSEPSYQLDLDGKKASNKRKLDQPNSPQAKYNLQSNFLEENAIALTLPPLTASEEYLPGAFDGYIWPAEGVLTSGYGWRWGRLHRGIDIAAPVGTPILAAATGEVVGAGWHEGYGNLIKLEHLDGSFTIYAHNNRILVSHGQQINQGEQIAEMGSTGYSTGSHLHFEIHSKDQEVINPLALLTRK